MSGIACFGAALHDPGARSACPRNSRGLEVVVEADAEAGAEPGHLVRTRDSLYSECAKTLGNSRSIVSALLVDMAVESLVNSKISAEVVGEMNPRSQTERP